MLTNYVNFHRTNLLTYKPRQTKSCSLRKPSRALLARQRDQQFLSYLCHYLSASLNAAAPMDDQRVTNICESLLSQMEGRLLAAFSNHFRTTNNKGIPDLRLLLPAPRSPLVYQEHFRLLLYNFNVDYQPLSQLLR